MKVMRVGCAATEVDVSPANLPASAEHAGHSAINGPLRDCHWG
jgi:hypothetical protein